MFDDNKPSKLKLTPGAATFVAYTVEIRRSSILDISKPRNGCKIVTNTVTEKKIR